MAGECIECKHTAPAPCHWCKAEAEEVRSRLLRALGGARALELFTFEAWKVELEADGHARKLMTDLRLASRGAYLSGPPGTGKTHAAAVLVRKWVSRGGWGALIPCSMLFDSLSRARRSGSYWSEVGYYARMGVLALDDVGQGETHERELSALYDVVNARYMSGVGGLVVTSNLNLDQLAEKFGNDRITSRLFEMSALVTWPDDAPDRRVALGKAILESMGVR